MNKLLGPFPYTFKFRMPDGKTRAFLGQHLSYKTGVVCGTCNNGWMAELENDIVKPTMKGMIEHGFPVTLLPRGLASLAVFAFKTTVVVNHMRPGSEFFSRSERRRFAKSLTIPDGVQVWIASRPRKRTGRVVSYVARTKRNMLGSFDMYLCTFSLSYLVLQLVALKWSSASPLHGLPFVRFKQEAKWEKVATQIWPLDGMAVSWPPPELIDGELFDEFCDRWTAIDLPEWASATLPMSCATGAGNVADRTS